MDEQFYVSLMMDHLPEDCEARGLISQGYLTEKMEHTQKALDFINDFLDAKKEAVYQAIKDLGPDARKSAIMQRAEIRQMGTFADVANKLVSEGRLKKEHGKY